MLVGNSYLDCIAVSIFYIKKIIISSKNSECSTRYIFLKLESFGGNLPVAKNAYSFLYLKNVLLQNHSLCDKEFSESRSTIYEM